MNDCKHEKIEIDSSRDVEIGYDDYYYLPYTCMDCGEDLWIITTRTGDEPLPESERTTKFLSEEG